MSNDRLRDAMLRNGLTPAAIADQIGVDPKTVERWITQDRTPYPKHRHAIAALVREGESYLWPGALSPERASRVAQSEVVEIYPRRSAMPAELWERMLDAASDQVGILAYGGLFLHEQNPKFGATLLQKAIAGTKVEVLLGDPESPQVAERGEEEGIGDSMASKIRNTLAFYTDLRGVANASVHFHRTTLYNSIYRFDDEMLVNTHLYGVPAAHAPMLHLRRLSGGHLFDNYSASFQRVWSRSRSVWPDS
jgi:transcriptional regulator with XRE-family HTH domain